LKLLTSSLAHTYIVEFLPSLQLQKKKKEKRKKKKPKNRIPRNVRILGWT
jgi:hypothetical protein